MDNNDSDGGIDVAWWRSRLGPDRGWQDWPDGESAVLHAGEALWLRVAVTNRGDYVELASRNLVAPFGAEVLQWDPRTRGYRPPLTGAENTDVGVAPDYRVQYFAEERPWPRDFTWVATYLFIPTDPLVVAVGTAMLVHDLNGGPRSSRLIAVPDFNQ